MWFVTLFNSRVYDVIASLWCCVVVVRLYLLCCVSSVYVLRAYLLYDRSRRSHSNGLEHRSYGWDGLTESVYATRPAANRTSATSMSRSSRGNALSHTTAHQAHIAHPVAQRPNLVPDPRARPTSSRPTDGSTIQRQNASFF